MCFAVAMPEHIPTDDRAYQIMLDHFRGSVVIDEILNDIELFVSDLGYDRNDANAAARTAAAEKGWR